MSGTPAFNAKCTGCGVELEIPGEYRGQTIQCPQCSAQFVANEAPAPSSKPNLDFGGAGGSAPKSSGSRSKTKRQAPIDGSGGGGGKRRRSNLPASRTYPAIETVRAVYNIFSFIVVGIVVLWALFISYMTFSRGMPGGMEIVVWLFTMLGAAASGALWFVSFRAIAELLKLLIDIQDNTLTTARNSER